VKEGGGGEGERERERAPNPDSVRAKVKLRPRLSVTRDPHPSQEIQPVGARYGPGMVSVYASGRVVVNLPEC
jgi:hypothetical protein